MVRVLVRAAGARSITHGEGRTASKKEPGQKRVDIVKWMAMIVQLVGYGLTGMNIVPWNVIAFMIGIVLWFLVGVMWKDRAIMVVRLGAFVAIVAGYVSS